MKLKKIKLVLLLLFLIGIWASVSLGYNFFYSLIPEVNDGITIASFLAQLILPDHSWSRIKYLELFWNTVKFTVLVGSVIVGIDIYSLIKELKNKQK